MLKEPTAELAVKLWELVGVIVFIIFLSIFRAFVFIKMWTWFIMPTFTTAPILNYPTAIGLSIIAGYFTSHPSNEDSGFKKLCDAFLFTLVAWFMAWVVHLFM